MGAKITIKKDKRRIPVPKKAPKVHTPKTVYDRKKLKQKDKYETDTQSA